MNVILQARVGKKWNFYQKSHPSKMFFNITSKVASGQSQSCSPVYLLNFSYNSYNYPTSCYHSHSHTWLMLLHQNAEKYSKRPVEF